MENKIYKVGELFKNIKTTKHITKAQIENNPGSTLVITGGDENYGVSGFYNVPGINKGNCITFSRTSTKSFYRDQDFNGLDSVAALYHEKLTENIAQYLITCFRKNADGYSYSNKRLPEKLKSEEISLPSIIHEDGTYEPDWDYMENYIAELRKKIDIYTQDSIKIIENVKSHRGEKLDISGWKEYKTTDIFEIRGTKKSKRKENNKPGYGVLSRTISNNGISAQDSEYTEIGNFISLDGFSGKTYYQKQNVFVSSCASHVHRIDLKGKKLNENLALFLVVCLNKNSSGHTRSNAREISDFKAETIDLPSIIHKDGTYEPDWRYMENYIEQLKKFKK